MNWSQFPSLHEYLFASTRLIIMLIEFDVALKLNLIFFWFFIYAHLLSYVKEMFFLHKLAWVSFWNYWSDFKFREVLATENKFKGLLRYFSRAPEVVSSLEDFDGKEQRVNPNDADVQTRYYWLQLSYYNIAVQCYEYMFHPNYDMLAPSLNWCICQHLIKI